MSRAEQKMLVSYYQRHGRIRRSSSQSRMQRHDWYSPLVDATTSVHCYRVFTGCGSLNGLRSGWRYSPTAVSTVQHPSTYPDVCTRRRLRSSSSTALVISRTVQVTIGDRVFSAAATSVWNSLPEAVSSSASLALFRKSLKTKLFLRSCSD